MPERAGIKYHVLCIEWVTQWKKYVDYEKVIGKKEEMKQEEGEELAQNFHHHDNLHNDEAKPGSEEIHPGILNSDPQKNAIRIGSEIPWLSHDDMDNIQIKTSCKCDEDFVILTDEAWNYLY